MFGRFASNIVRFFIKNRIVSLLLLSGLVCLFLYGVSRLNIEEDIYSVFPKGQEYQEFNDMLQKNNLNKQVVFSLTLANNEENLQEKIEDIVNQLNKKFANELDNFKINSTVDEKQLIQYLQKASVTRLKRSDYEKLSYKLNKDSIDFSVSKTADRLNNGDGFFIRSILALDPLGITAENLSLLNSLNDSTSFKIKDGFLYSKDEKSVLFLSTIKISLKNTAELTRFNLRLLDFFKEINSKIYPQKLDCFGTFQIAAENAGQIKKDSTLTAIIGVLLIFLLLTIYYRSILAPFYFILPALFGLLFGGGLVGFLHPNISAISLATSSVLIGIVIDYSLHFFTHYKHSGDLIKTIREISAPMIVGSFTTVAALAALMFANSVVLQDFGLIALCVLSSSVLFTIFFLPVLIDVLPIRIKDSANKVSTIKTNKSLLRISIVLISVLTFVYLMKGVRLSFDSDLNNLSYHSSSLKQKEETLTGINPEEHKKLYVISKSKSFDEAKEINEKIYDALVINKDSFKINELISTAPYLISSKRLEQSKNQWERFWLDKKENTESLIKSAGKRNNLSEFAFESFYEWTGNGSVDTSLGSKLSADLGLNKFIYQDAGETSIITSIVLDREHVDRCKQTLRQIQGAYILDVADITEQMMNSVKDDFNYLLLFSAMLVFFSLLVVYGRIELALFAMFPMVLSWIWILGVAELFHIKFNFVNIVITTFIFGLGDDFSIFTTDGLIQRYKNGTNVLKSYRSAIILSGVTTIIGTGTLYFAKHPAISSISLISVIGISCILLITLYIQPFVFDLFITNRVKKGRVPVTFLNLIYSLFLFLYFLTGCLVLNLFLFLFIIPFPAKKSQKRKVLNFIVSKLAKSTLYLGVHVKKRILFPERLNFSKPCIIVSNHTSFLDILLVIMLNPKVLIMVKGWVYNSPFFGFFIRYAGYPFSEIDADTNLDLIRKRIDEGYSIAIFPEGTRSATGQMNRFHKGAFFLAKELGLDIQPIVLIGPHEVNPKNDILISKSHLIVLPLERISSTPTESFSQYTKRVSALMRSEYEKGKIAYAKTDFWGTKILKNYIFKGPILEWYVRVKWKLEKTNYEFYDEYIGDRKTIYDLGCGYGYLSYYLHYRDERRTIIGIDYDEEKTKIASYGIIKSPLLSFLSADLRAFDFQQMDVVFLNDVLHYLSKQEQYDLLNKIAKKLNKGGVLFIRDGLNESSSSFKRMKFTEFLSTKVFKFNKTTNKLDFIYENEILEFARTNGFSLQKVPQSKTTTNVLFILHK